MKKNKPYILINGIDISSRTTDSLIDSGIVFSDYTVTDTSDEYRFSVSDMLSNANIRVVLGGTRTTQFVSVFNPGIMDFNGNLNMSGVDQEGKISGGLVYTINDTTNFNINTSGVITNKTAFNQGQLRDVLITLNDTRGHIISSIMTFVSNII